MSSTAVQTAKNLIFGFVLLRAFSFVGIQDGVPLFGFLNAPVFYHLRWALSFAMLGLWLSRRFEKPLLLLASFAITFQFVLSYSNVGAFSFTPFFLFIFAFLFLAPARESAKPQAAVLVTAIFFCSAIQKMNPGYLSGQEFSGNGSFVSFLRLWMPSFEFPSQGLIPTGLAAGSIGLELLIGLGLLARPALFAHVTVFFILMLALIHPPVLYVYFFFLPLLVLISPTLDRMYGAFLGRERIWIPIAIALLIKFVSMESTSTSSFPIVTFFLTIALIFSHLRFFLRENERSEDIKPETSARTIRTFVLPGVIALTLIGSAFFLPSPLGFSMFAASRFRIPTYAMENDDVAVCEAGRLKWRFSLVTDSSLDLLPKGGCRFRFPTKSGLLTIAKVLCEAYPNTSFRWIESERPTEQSCTDISAL